MGNNLLLPILGCLLISELESFSLKHVPAGLFHPVG
jgi:hypothetical protein